MAGSEIPIDTPTPKDCCAGSNDGQSYSDSGGNCVVPQCVGKRSLHFVKPTKFTENIMQV